MNVPLVVVRGDGFAVVRALVAALGWSVVTQAPAVAADVLAMTVADEEDVGAAVAAVLAGAGLVADARGLGAAAHVALCDDLRRLGDLRVVDEDEPAVEAAALLDLLASGRSLGDAAALLHLSRRSADRRLAEARAALGAATTAQAVARSRRRPLCSAPGSLPGGRA